MAADSINRLNDEALDSVSGGAGEAGKKQYPEWVNTIAKTIGSPVYEAFDRDGGHGVYLDLVQRFGPLSYYLLSVPEEFRY